MGRTTIQVPEELADELYERKQRGDSYADVIWRLIEHADATDSVGAEAESAPSAGSEEGGVQRSIRVPDGVPDRIDEAAARAAIAATLDLVTSNGGVQRSEIADKISESHSLNYDNFGRKGAWWRKVIRPGLEANGCEYTNGVGWTAAEGR